MKRLTQILSLCVLTLALAHCGKKGGGGAAPVAPTSDTANDSTEIVFNSGSGGQPIAWSEVRRNIYFQTNSACVIGLAQSGNEPVVQEALGEIRDLINTSTIGKGSRDSVAANAAYLTLRNRDGSVRTFNLNSDLASQGEETLSKGAEIIAVYAEIKSALDIDGVESCNYGK